MDNKVITPAAHVPTAINIADLHTKSVSRQVVEALRPKAKGYDPLWTDALFHGADKTD